MVNQTRNLAGAMERYFDKKHVYPVIEKMRLSNILVDFFPNYGLNTG